MRASLGQHRSSHARAASHACREESPDRVLIELGKDRTTHPLEALESADVHRGVLVQPLLQLLERCVTDPDSASEAPPRSAIDVPTNIGITMSPRRRPGWIRSRLRLPARHLDASRGASQRSSPCASS